MEVVRYITSKNRGFLLFLGIMLFSVVVCAQPYPYQNPALSSEERARDLISRLTLEEKATLMCDQSDAIPRLGIKKFNWWSEALHGYANNDNVTVFPQNIGMAASFNDQLVYTIFDAVSDEARAKYHQWLEQGNENKRFLSLSVWTPNVNIFRDPRWGRGQETYGEDPYLTSRMGTQVVKGLQGPEDAKYRKLLACAKHFAVHSGPEWSRHELNLNAINPRELHETYLPAFKALVQDAGVRQVMCAYQRIDDEPCCGSSRLLQRILRDEWGFQYIVVSDCGAITDFYTSHKVSSTPVHAASKAVLAGTDVECVWENYPYKTLPEGVERGLIREEDIDKSLLRVLIGRFDLGDFDDDALVPWAQIPASVLNCEKHRELAYRMAQQTMTLLRNNDDILPLSRKERKIAVIGPNAADTVMLWGNYNGTPVRTISILDGIKTKLPGKRIFYDKGCDLVEDKVTRSYFAQLSFEGKPGFKATYWNNPNREGDPVASTRLTNPIKMTTAGQHEFAPGVKLEGFSALFRAEFTPEVTEELVFKGGATGYYELLVNGERVQMYNNWRTLPSRIPYTFEAGKKYAVEIRYAQLNNWQANIEFDFGKEVDVDYSALIEKLKGIETVVFVGGLSGNLEGEEMPVSYPGFRGGDRLDIELPAVQRNCLQALKDAGKKVIFVNCSGSAIALAPEVKSCDAILQAWYAGESGGLAVADVLFGDYNPSGKLPVTFYKNSDNLGDFEDYSMNGRTYRYTTDYLFPFGFGLSYTTFEIGEAKLSGPSLRVQGTTSQSNPVTAPGTRTTVVKEATEPLTLTVPVTNTGKRYGTEIVQVYIRKVNDVEGPLKTLRGYQRVTVPAGKTRQVTIELPPSAFEFFDWGQRQMTVTPGEYQVYYGNSSADEDLKTVTVTILETPAYHSFAPAPPVRQENATQHHANAYHSFAPAPPLGWNSWDIFGTTVNEQQIKEQADAMAEHLLPSGYQYLTVDIQWYEPESKRHFYNPVAELTMDAYGRLTPGLKKFPSAAGGKGFKPLADYVHSKGLKLGIHIMRGIPRQAVEKNLPVLGTNVRAADIALTGSTCPWNPDMYGVDATREEGRAYYRSIIEMYAEWGVDYIKVDDISRPYDVVQKAEIDAIREAIDLTGRPIVLSLSPGATPLSAGEHVMRNANLWRITDDFWDRWELLYAMFERLDAWTLYRGPGHYPDADMLPIGVIDFGRPTKFTPDEHYTLMSLWAIARSPLIFGGDMTQLDPFTKEMLTNPSMLKVNQESTNNRQISRDRDLIVWAADIPGSPDKYLALFNARSPEERAGGAVAIAKAGGLDPGAAGDPAAGMDTTVAIDAAAPSCGCIVAVDLSAIGIQCPARVTDLWHQKDLGIYDKEFNREIPFHGAGLYRVSPVR